MSYRKKHIKNKIGSIKPKELFLKRPWFWIGFLLLIIMAAGLYLGLFYDGLQVKHISISGNQRVSTQEIYDFVSQKMVTGLVRIGPLDIKTRSILLVDKEKISKDILDKFPIIEKISFRKDYPQTLVLGIEERKPIGVYCNLQNQCYLIDQNGIIFEAVSYAPENTTILRQAVEDRQVFTGEEAVSKNIIEALYKVQSNLKEKFSIDLSEAFVTSPIRLNVKTSQNWQIYFDLESGSDIDEQITKLNLLLDGGITEESRASLRYIDLRPKDRAIICDNDICGL